MFVESISIRHHDCSSEQHDEKCLAVQQQLNTFLVFTIQSINTPIYIYVYFKIKISSST